ncbi:MAG: type II secretion system protein [Phycisphaeraceae bacterium]|nr:MAG: type II secretion system protein [Phycisphaeraceae bacterium]
MGGDAVIRPVRTGLAFTLLELLVSVAVIATLLGLLTPSLMGARQAARQAACASNLRQVVIAGEMYASDHREHWMPGAAGIQRDNLQRWHGVRDETGRPFRAEGAPITAYLSGESGSVGVRRCPTFAGTLDSLRESEAGFESGNGGYGYNNAFVGVVRRRMDAGLWEIETDERGSARWMFAGPSRTVVFTDAAFPNSHGSEGVIEYSFAEPRFWPHFAGARPIPTIHFLHTGSANAAWLDGSVTSASMARSYAETHGVEGRDAMLALGWFGREDDNGLFDYE